MSRVICECGTELLKTSLKAHLLTQKHKKLLEAKQIETSKGLTKDKALGILTSAIKSRKARQEYEILEIKKGIRNLTKKEILKIEEGAVKKIESAFKNRLLREKAKDKLEYLRYKKELRDERIKNPPRYTEAEAKLILGRVFQSYSKKLEATNKLSELRGMSFEEQVAKDRKETTIIKKFFVKSFDFDKFMKEKEYTSKEYKKVINELYDQLTTKSEIDDDVIKYLINQIYQKISMSDKEIIDDYIDEEDDTLLILYEIHRNYVHTFEKEHYSMGHGTSDYIVEKYNPLKIYEDEDNIEKPIEIMKTIYTNIDKDENNINKIYFQGYKQFKKIYHTKQNQEIRDDLIINIIESIPT